MAGWTPDEDERLRDLWKQGLPTALIGAQMGRGKNAIIGRAHRLNLSGRGSPITRCAEPTPVKTPVLPKKGSLQGMRIGRSVVQAPAPRLPNDRRPRWYVRCHCGREDIVFEFALTGATVAKACRSCSQKSNAAVRFGSNEPAAAVVVPVAPRALTVEIAPLPEPKPSFPTQQTPYAPSRLAPLVRKETRRFAAVRTCQYPTTDSRPWRFCGEPAVPGTSWCAACQARVFVQKRQAHEVAA